MGKIFAVLGVGAVVLVIGVALLIEGYETGPGYLFAGVGGIVTQVGIIALGVRLGTDA